MRFYSVLEFSSVVSEEWFCDTLHLFFSEFTLKFARNYDMMFH